MPKQSSSTMPVLSSEKDATRFIPRSGQKAVVDFIKYNPDSKLLAVKLPGGYGKSIAIAMAYKAKRDAGVCDRLLIVVANDTQREQVRADFATDCSLIGLNISGVWGFNREANTIIANKNGRAEVFIATIQQVSSTNKSEIDTLAQLLGMNGKWMLAADEYHHYADGNDWGDSLKRVRDMCEFTIALSATPDRDGNPTIFGDPKVSMSYRDAVNESALKTLEVKRYHYSVEAITSDGEVVRYTTDELRDEIGDVGKVDTFEEKRQLRYSAKYVHPILLNPIERLIRRRVATGVNLQMLVRAFSCRHAQIICEQIKSLATGDLRVDWIGTGPNGRSDEDNSRITRDFCPTKGDDGQRRPHKLDVLVQVGMAGEGFDSVCVAEIVDLGIVALKGASNNTKQFYKRGSRWIKGVDKSEQICFVNIPSDHPLAGKSFNVMEWLDSASGLPGSDDDGSQDSDAEVETWQNEPAINVDRFKTLMQMRDIKLTSISSDDPHFCQFVKRMNDEAPKRGKLAWDMNCEDDVNAAKAFYLIAANSYAKQHDEQSRIAQMREEVDRAVGSLARLATRKYRVPGTSVTKDIIGDRKKRINGRLKQTYGARESLMPEALLQQIQDLAIVEQAIINGEVFTWLA